MAPKAAAKAPKAKKTPTKKAAKPKAEKKEKKEKDPNAPKRGLSAYFIFTKEARPKVVADNPGVPVTEIAKLLGEAWKKVSEKDKKKYTDLAAKDKERYEKEIAAYNKKK